jgi:hypothetical protein
LGYGVVLKHDFVGNNYVALIINGKEMFRDEDMQHNIYIQNLEENSIRAIKIIEKKLEVDNKKDSIKRV